MIHFVEKFIHYVKGGTGFGDCFAEKFKELGGTIKYNSEVEKLLQKRVMVE